MDGKAQLKKYQELFEVQARIAEMENARTRDVLEWNRLIKEARRLEESLRAEIAAASWQPDLPFQGGQETDDDSEEEE